jgi:hypothetical protein
MRNAVVLLLVVAAVSGCSSWHYERKGVTSAQVADDFYDCRRSSTEASLVSIPSLWGDQHVSVPEQRLSRGAFNSCMRERGYSVRWD